jgi:maltose alpha-D-glucosyltransferase/alpha-amylase
MMHSRDEYPVFQAWATFWSRWISSRFLGAYLTTAAGAPFLPREQSEVKLLLDVFLLEKAVYELGYEINNRPTWVRVPIAGIQQVLDSQA